MKKDSPYEEKNVKSIKKENMKLGILFIILFTYVPTQSPTSYLSKVHNSRHNNNLHYIYTLH